MREGHGFTHLQDPDGGLQPYRGRTNRKNERYSCFAYDTTAILRISARPPLKTITIGARQGPVSSDPTRSPAGRIVSRPRHVLHARVCSCVNALARAATTTAGLRRRSREIRRRYAAERRKGHGCVSVRPPARCLLWSLSLSFFNFQIFFRFRDLLTSNVSSSSSPDTKSIDARSDHVTTLCLTSFPVP